MRHSSFLIAAPMSESGKSTVTIGILRALERRGITAQPFKCGPDYIDPKLHQVACHRTSINLDLFMKNEAQVQESFARYDATAEVSIVEGVMGLFDGYDKDLGSSAHLARTLGLPIILVVTPKSMAYSVAPLLYGIKNFQKELNIIGVLFNKVNSESHYLHLQEACKDTGVRCLGKLPTDPNISLPSRYLGIETEDQARLELFAEQAADLIENNIALEQILEFTASPQKSAPEPLPKLANLKISVAKDEAFNFIYPENICTLEQFGDITYFSPIHNRYLPESDFIYLPGGYPELYLPQLSQNTSLMQSIREHIEAGKSGIAEGGGMLYLSKTLTDRNGKNYAMVGLFDQAATMEEARLSLGYRQFDFKGMKVKGHEFHYSRLIDPLPTEIQQHNAHNIAVPTPTLLHKGILASYTHLTFTPDFIEKLIEKQV